MGSSLPRPRRGWIGFASFRLSSGDDRAPSSGRRARSACKAVGFRAPGHEAPLAASGVWSKPLGSVGLDLESQSPSSFQSRQTMQGATNKLTNTHTGTKEKNT